LTFTPGFTTTPVPTDAPKARKSAHFTAEGQGNEVTKKKRLRPIQRRRTSRERPGLYQELSNAAS
jgi:hypothetical protein